MHLVAPSSEHLPSYIAALERGWSADNERPETGMQELGRIRQDPMSFIASINDPEANGSVTLPDGSVVPRLPGFRRWMWDGEFAGSINLRWQPGTTDLPPHCLGHIGYAVVPWKRRRGYATAALKKMLEHARLVGLPFVVISTSPDNIASQRVIEAAGGVLQGHFTKPPSYGSKPGLRYRIELGDLLHA